MIAAVSALTIRRGRRSEQAHRWHYQLPRSTGTQTQVSCAQPGCRDAYGVRNAVVGIGGGAGTHTASQPNRSNLITLSFDVGQLELRTPAVENISATLACPRLMILAHPHMTHAAVAGPRRDHPRPSRRRSARRNRDPPGKPRLSTSVGRRAVSPSLHSSRSRSEQLDGSVFKPFNARSMPMIPAAAWSAAGRAARGSLRAGRRGWLRTARGR
jgi:hypothetical protein